MLAGYTYYDCSLRTPRRSRAILPLLRARSPPARPPALRPAAAASPQPHDFRDSPPSATSSALTFSSALQASALRLLGQQLLQRGVRATSGWKAATARSRPATTSATTTASASGEVRVPSRLEGRKCSAHLPERLRRPVEGHLQFGVPVLPARVHGVRLLVALVPLGYSSHGTCFNGTCYCAPGFRGVGCNEPTCFNDCSGNGLCSQGVCKCYPGWAGTDCAIKVCPGAVGGVPCSAHGSCLANAVRAPTAGPASTARSRRAPPTARTTATASTAPATAARRAPCWPAASRRRRRRRALGPPPTPFPPPTPSPPRAGRATTAPCSRAPRTARTTATAATARASATRRGAGSRAASRRAPTVLRRGHLPERATATRLDGRRLLPPRALTPGGPRRLPQRDVRRPRRQK